MKQRKNLLRLIFILIVILIVLIILIINLIPKNENKINNNEEVISSENNVDTKEENSEEEEIKMLQNMSERARMQYYFGKYIKYIENEKYKEAYALLYDEFKQNYMPTLGEFIEYLSNKYPFQVISVEYNNIERNGDIYVLWVSIVDPINGDPTSEDKIEQNVVIRENDLNDFVLSFSV